MAKIRTLSGSRIITRQAAICLGRIFMACYHKGVADACRYRHDEGMLREFLGEVRLDGLSFGFIDSNSRKWVYWKNRLSDIAAADKRYRTFNVYLERMREYRANYMSVALVMAQAFYNRGITDFLDRPQAQEVAAFMEKNQWWNDRKTVDGFRLRAYVQDVCSEIIDSIEGESENALKQCHYEVFMQAFSFSIVAKKP